LELTNTKLKQILTILKIKIQLWKLDQLIILKYLHLKSKESNRLKALEIQQQSKKALDDLTEAARTGKGNLLALSIVASRARCTVGEISDALEKIYGRYKPNYSLAKGAYRSSFSEAIKDDGSLTKVMQQVETFSKREGRPPRILVAKVGQDGHDRGAKVIASGFSDMGFDCDIGPLFSTPEEVVQQAIDSDVHVVGISSLAAGHKSLMPRIVQLLKDNNRGDMVVVCGGVIPEQDYAFLYQSGVDLIFGPGTKVPQAASNVILKIESKQKK